MQAGSVADPGRLPSSKGGYIDLMFFGPLRYAAAGSASGDVDFLLLFSYKPSLYCQIAICSADSSVGGSSMFSLWSSRFIGRPNLEDNQPHGGTLCYLTRQD